MSLIVNLVLDPVVTQQKPATVCQCHGVTVVDMLCLVLRIMCSAPDTVLL